MNLNSIIARNRAATFLTAKADAEQFFGPHLQRWLDLEVKEGNLSNHEAQQEFLPTEVTATGIEFESGMSEETWNYGGYELHYGNTVTIPFEFFDDPKPFEEALEQKLKAREDEKSALTAKAKKDQIRRLETQLAKARAEL